jgi:serine/threonine protein phosphatase PrpC
LDFATVSPFEIRACATRGLSHRHNGTPRQDSFAIAVDDQRVVLAVADGVSQGPWSHVAAETGARAACKLVLDHAGRDGIDWSVISRRVSMRIVEEAEYRRHVEPPDQLDDYDARIARCRAVMSSTLVVATISRLANGSDAFDVDLAVLAGDSGAYVIDADGIRLAVGGKADGDSPVTSSAVRPLPGPVSPETTAVSLEEGQALVLVSDGLGDPIGDGAGEVGQELAKRWLTPPTIDKFLLDVNFYRRSFDDDRTAVGLWILPALVAVT